MKKKNKKTRVKTNRKKTIIRKVQKKNNTGITLILSFSDGTGEGEGGGGVLSQEFFMVGKQETFKKKTRTKK